MVSWSNLEKLCSCSRTWMMSALACGNKWIQGGTYRLIFDLQKYVNWLCVFSKVNPFFQKAQVFCMDLQPAADPAMFVNTYVCPQHRIKHKAAINDTKHWLRTVIAALCFIPFCGHNNEYGRNCSIFLANTILFKQMKMKILWTCLYRVKLSERNSHRRSPFTLGHHLPTVGAYSVTW